MHVGPELRVHDGSYAYVRFAAMQHVAPPLLGFQGGHEASDRCEGDTKQSSDKDLVLHDEGTAAI